MMSPAPPVDQSITLPVFLSEISIITELVWSGLEGQQSQLRDVLR